MNAITFVWTTEGKSMYVLSGEKQFQIRLNEIKMILSLFFAYLGLYFTFKHLGLRFSKP